MPSLPSCITALWLLSSSVSAFVPVPNTNNKSSSLAMADAAATSNNNHLLDPQERDARYGKEKTAQYLLDLHDSKATFDFCGGMMFQLVLTDALRDHLKTTKDQPVVFDVARMSGTPNYTPSAQADNCQIFHGREIRKVRNAAGGMGMVLQLSLANSEDPEGWTTAEQERYDGWGHDSGREWRKGPQLEQEGFANFREQFGPDAFALHHRFYLHSDAGNRMWLSAEDGCEGTPAAKPGKSLNNLFGLL